VCSAECPADQLFTRSDDMAKYLQEARLLMDDLNIQEVSRPTSLTNSVQVLCKLSEVITIITCNNCLFINFVCDTYLLFVRLNVCSTVLTHQIYSGTLSE